MSGHSIARVKAGALIKDGRLGPSLSLFNWLTTFGMAGLVLRRIRESDGGIWVGGFAELRSDCLKFDPNELNESTTAGTLFT